MNHVPSRLLRDAQIPVNLHARHALEVRAHEIESNDPLAEFQVTTVHGRPGLDAEILPAVGAPVGHRLLVRD